MYEFSAQEVYDMYSMQNIEDEVSRLFPETEISLKEIFTAIFSGEIENTFSYFSDAIWKMFAGELSELKTVFVLILTIGIVAALFSNFMDIFENHQIADMSFYFAYLLLMLLLLRTFKVAVSITAETLENLLIFMKLFIPTYITAVSVASGTTTAYVFYKLMLIAIYWIENILSSFLLPFIYGYAFLSVVNGLWTEERFTNILELIKKDQEIV